MNMRLKGGIFAVIILLAFAPTVWAHTPLESGGENNSLGAAMEIPNPTKSWTLYRELHEDGEAEYYVVRLGPGERLKISLYVPRNEDPGFAPSLVVMGPGMESGGEVPEYIEVPEGAGAILVEAERPERPEYEPFTPTSYYHLGDFEKEIASGGSYHFAVFDPHGEGRYGLAIGYVETYTVTEWVKIPMDIVAIRQWEGQSLLVYFAPMLATLAIGMGLLFRGRGREMGTYGLVCASSGLLYVGSGLVILMEMMIYLYGADYDPIAFLTIVFVLLPVLLGYLILRKANIGHGSLSSKDRIALVALGVSGLFAWAGFFAGPALAVIAGIMPSGK
jgi:hypothetical protein